MEIVAPAGPSRARRGGVTAAAAALVALHAVLGWWLRPATLSLADDDTIYVLLGRSLRELHYRSPYLVGEPAHVQYPPGFPALLALAGAVVGERMDLLAALQALLSAAALALTFDAVRRRWSPALALLALTLAAVNPLLLETAGTLWSEPPFMALVALSLWAASGAEPSARRLALAGAAAVAAALTRSAGVALVAGLALAWCTERRWRAVALLGAAAGVALGGWFLWTALAPSASAHHPYALDMARGYQRAAGAATLAGAAGAALLRMIYIVAAYPAALVPWNLPLPTVEGTAADNVAWLVVVLASGALGARELWRRWRAAACFLLCYGGVLAVWPWALDRFLAPVMPLVLILLLAGLAAAARWAADRWRLPSGARLAHAAPAAFAVAVAVPALARDARLWRGRAACDRSSPTRAEGCVTADGRSFYRAAEFVRDSTPPGAVVVTLRAASLNYRTGHPAIVAGTLPGAGAPRLPGGGYVLLSRLFASESTFAGGLRARCDRLTLVKRFPPRTFLFRVADPPPGEAGAACSALDWYRANAWLPDDTSR